MKNMKKHLVGLTIVALATATLVADAQAATLSDAQIAKIAVTANTIDIRGGQLAQSVTKDKGIQSFAKDMVKDHSANNDENKQLAKKLNMKPQDSEQSKALQKEGDAMLVDLKKLTGKSFEKAYVDNEVAFHQKVLDSIDQDLIPNAQNPELKAQLEKTRPVVAEHLGHAKMLQSSMTK